MRKRINPETDTCKRGHVGYWRKTVAGTHTCGLCAREYHRVLERQKRIQIRKDHMTLVLAFRAIPGSIAKAADLLHLPRKKVHDMVHGHYRFARWRIKQLKAVLELCIMTNGGNGNGHHA